MSEATRVLIAGAGPVGLTAALLLGSKGIPVGVLESQAAISEELRASTFHPPTLDMMAPFGITARMLEAGLVCACKQGFRATMAKTPPRLRRQGGRGSSSLESLCPQALLYTMK